MPTIEYNLYRIKLIRPKQPRLPFDAPGIATYATLTDLFLQALAERPILTLRNRFEWHLGKISRISDTTGYFAFGRTTTKTVERFNAATGDFTEEDLETSPYTHCVYNAEIGLIAIAKKAVLAPTTKGIASKLQMVFSKAKVIEDIGIVVEILPIPNPNEFVDEIQNAWQVSKFSATFGGPNPFDADEFFQKPLSALLKQVDGQRGKAEVKGKDLSKEVTIEVTRSTAAVGNSATARIRRSQKSPAETIKLSGDPTKLIYGDDLHDPKEVIREVTETYNRIRTNDAQHSN